MNLLPNWENAVIPSGKLENYCLSSYHPKGKDKARVFKAVLGYSEEDAGHSGEIIFDGIAKNEAVLNEIIQWGEIWRVDIPLILQNDIFTLRTNWIIRTNENFPSLISCFIKI
jgi:hypothetical protein